jgi:hypothetical protein
MAGLFCDKDACFDMPSSDNVMNIRGSGMIGEGVEPVFFEKPQLATWPFFVIASSRPALFFESSATDLKIF